MSSDELVIDVERVSKRYEIYAHPRDRLKQMLMPRLHRVPVAIGARRSSAEGRSPSYFREFWALNDVSFQVRRGETLGIIGRNGSGKSTLLQIIAGTLRATAGDVRVNGRVAALLELGSGFNPEFTGRENVYLNGRILGLKQEEIEARFDRIADFADIGAFIDQPVKSYSSGMFVRLAFAVQAHIDASIVIIDEALAVGDVFFRQKCYRRLDQLRATGAAILLVTHSMPDVEQYCERALWLDHGRQRFIGSAKEATKRFYLDNQPAVVSDDRKEEASVPPDPCGAQSTAPAADLPFRRPRTQHDASGITQASVGSARCLQVTITDPQGQATHVFEQGQTAIFQFDFELTAHGVPVCGVVITNDRGVICHGKNSWQYDATQTVILDGHATVACQQEIRLDLAPGEYSFEVGLALVSVRDWQRRESISHEAFASLHQRICHVPQAGTLSIGLAHRNGVAVLTHHGVADLHGSFASAIIR